MEEENKAVILVPMARTVNCLAVFDYYCYYMTVIATPHLIILLASHGVSSGQLGALRIFCDCYGFGGETISIRIAERIIYYLEVVHLKIIFSRAEIFFFFCVTSSIVNQYDY
jgi:hypothetical protein